MRPDGHRDTFAGLESGPESPFPIRIEGPIVKGFGRGSKEVCVACVSYLPFAKYSSSAYQLPTYL
jgi:hypothetical protein